MKRVYDFSGIVDRVEENERNFVFVPMRIKTIKCMQQNCVPAILCCDNSVVCRLALQNTLLKQFYDIYFVETLINCSAWCTFSICLLSHNHQQP